MAYEILVFSEDHFFESLRSSNIMVALKIPTPTPAPDRGGPVSLPLWIPDSNASQVLLTTL